MTEPIESYPDLKGKTLKIAYDSNLGDLINDISGKSNLIDFESQSTIPIPPELIEEGKLFVILKDEPKEYYDTYLELINKNETALEFPFLLTGKTIQTNNLELTNIKPLHTNIESLKNNIIKMPDYSKALGEEIYKKKDIGFDIYVLGHTHPLPKDQTKQNHLTEKLDTETKSRYNIKKLGLNISLQDLYQLVYFEDAVKGIVSPESKILISILMFNGNMTYIYIEDGKFKRAKVL